MFCLVLSEISVFSLGHKVAELFFFLQKVCFQKRQQQTDLEYDWGCHVDV